MDLHTKRLRGEITCKILELPVVAPIADTHKVTAPSGVRYHAISVDFLDHPSRVAAGIPASTSTVFLNISQCPLGLLISLLASLTDSEAEGVHFYPGKFMTMIDDNFLNMGVGGILFVPICVADILADLKEEFYKDGRRYNFLLLVFISEEELNFIKSYGYDALLDRFEATDRDLIVHQFRSP